MIHIFTKHICVCINTYMQKHTHKTHILLLAKTLPVLHSLCNTFYFPVQILKMELVHLFLLHLLPPIFPPKLSPRRGIFISPPPIFLLPRLPMCPQTLKDNKIAKTGEVTNQFKNSKKIHKPKLPMQAWVSHSFSRLISVLLIFDTLVSVFFVRTYIFQGGDPQSFLFSK